MRLTHKTAFVIAAALAIATVANMLLLQQFVQPTFDALDRTHAAEDHKRVRDAIATDLQSVADKTQDWSHWDDLYSYGNGTLPSFPQENLQAEQVTNMALATALVVDHNFRILYQVNADITTDKPLPPLVMGTHLPRGLRATFAADDFTSKASVVAQNGTIHLAAIAPIVKSDGSGPPAGYIVFARPVDRAYVTELGNRLEVDVALRAPRPGESANRVENDQMIVEASTMLDQSGDTTITVITRTPRDVKNLGDTVLLWTSAGLVLIGILAAIGGAAMINRMVVSPVSRIASHMAQIGKTADLTAKLQEDRGDEIGALAKQLNSMAAELDEARKTLVDQTYASGMSEMASGVLHNVRNAMNPIGVRLWTLQKLLNEQISENFKRAVTELSGDAVDAERRRKLGAFAAATVDEIFERRDKMTREFADVVACGRHIEDVLRDFDEVSIGPRALEAVALRDIAEAARVSAGADPKIKLVVDATVEAMPAVKGNRVVLQQVVANLLKNAKEAIAKARLEGGTIRLAAARIDEDGSAFVEIAVADDGIGIEPGRQDAIFTRGHSTNDGGNRGLGLHWCANSLKTMGGAIRVYSAGIGQGSTFVVRLPIHQTLGDAAA